MTIYFSILFLLLGMVLGSFLNCMSMRVLRHEDFIHGHSHCMHCGHILNALDLIPVLSFILSGGRCRYCKKKISIRYPVSELCFGLLIMFLYLKHGLTPFFIQAFLFTTMLFSLSLTDLEAKIIPNGFLLTSLIFFALSAPFCHTPGEILLHHILPMLVYGGGILCLSLIMDKILGRESMGGGDVKLIAVIALYLGWFKSLFALFLSSLLGLLAIAFLNKLRESQEEQHEHKQKSDNANTKTKTNTNTKTQTQNAPHTSDKSVSNINDTQASVKNTYTPIPFGPFLSIATYIMLLFGDDVLKWYASFF